MAYHRVDVGSVLIVQSIPFVDDAPKVPVAYDAVTNTPFPKATGIQFELVGNVPVTQVMPSADTADAVDPELTVTKTPFP